MPPFPAWPESEVARLQPLFLLFLPFYILPYHLLVQAHRSDTVSLGPKVVALVTPGPQVSERAKHSDRGPTLQLPHVTRDRHLGRNHRNHMHMIGLNVQLNHFALHLPILLTDAKFHLLFQPPLHNSITALRDPHNMVFAKPHRMGHLFESAHGFSFLFCRGDDAQNGYHGQMLLGRADALTPFRERGFLCSTNSLARNSTPPKSIKNKMPNWVRP